MSGDVTYQALERLTHMPDRSGNQGDVIAGQKYNDVYLAGGTITGITPSGLPSPIAISDGGTGQTTANAALNALLPTQTGNNGKVLKTDGSNTSWASDTSGITQLTGDVTAGPGSGSQVATLATVNSNIGSFGSSTAIPSVTVNAKGLITAASTNAVIAPAGTLTGTTLAANVVSSSLTSVGTLTGGATGAGFTVALTTSTVTGTLGVANGGTGLGTLTANNVILGNGTSAPTFVAPGTSGNLLTSNGTTWQSTAPVTVVKSVKRQTFPSSGTYTPSAGLINADVECWGGGGGGGGVSGVNGAVAAGGGVGGYSRKIISAATIGASQTVTVGIGGTAGVNTGGTGGTGGTSSFGAILSCTGGVGGIGNTSANASALGGVGGVGSGGDLNLTGTVGCPAITCNLVVDNTSGFGGSSSLGGNGNSKTSNSPGNGNNATANSASGGGGAASSGSAQTGGVGGSGFITIIEYCSQ